MIKEFDPVDMTLSILAGLYNVCLIIASVYLCLHFNAWYFILLMFFVQKVKYKSLDYKEIELSGKLIEMDCCVEFNYDESYQDIVFADTELHIMIPNDLVDRFKLIDSHEWDEVFIKSINKKVKGL